MGQSYFTRIFRKFNDFIGMGRTKKRQEFNWEYIKGLGRHYLLNPHNLLPTCILLYICEVALNIYIIEYVKYTEIDWKAYMQEVEGFLNGTRDYSQLKGDTGPLVYPAGFVYFYSTLYYLTDYGTDIFIGQVIFLSIYLCQIILYYRILLRTAKIPPYALIIATCTSYRIHSIFVLRLFNDPVAVVLFYVALNLFLDNYWKLGSFFFSLAVSIKMNILLYAPCLLLVYLTNLSIRETIINLGICGLLQVLMGVPFLIENPYAYIKGSFDVGRVFNHTWTVNYRFLPVDLFENRWFHISLLGFHLGLLAFFYPLIWRYLSSYSKLNVVVVELQDQIERKREKKRLAKKKEEENLTKKQRAFLRMFEDQLKHNDASSPPSADDFEDNCEKLQAKFSKIAQLFILPFYITNFIGILCARSLHYQFYSWYFHSLLYLVFCTTFSTSIKFLLLAILEYCWNVYPSTNLSSILLHCCHFVILIGVYLTMRK